MLANILTLHTHLTPEMGSKGVKHCFQWVVMLHIKWALTQENLSSGVCEQQRRKPVCPSLQSDQRLFYSLIEKYHI